MHTVLLLGADADLEVRKADHRLVQVTHSELCDVRVTSDVKHVEIGLTDKSDSGHWIMRSCVSAESDPGRCSLSAELGPLGGLPGSDSSLLVDEARGVRAVSVGIEPGGVPVGVVALGGGPDAFATLLEDQIERRRPGEVPVVDPDSTWMLVIEASTPCSKVRTSRDRRWPTVASACAAACSLNTRAPTPEREPWPRTRTFRVASAARRLRADEEPRQRLRMSLTTSCRTRADAAAVVAVAGRRLVPCRRHRANTRAQGEMHCSFAFDSSADESPPRSRAEDRRPTRARYGRRGLLTDGQSL